MAREQSKWRVGLRQMRVIKHGVNNSELIPIWLSSLMPAAVQIVEVRQNSIGSVTCSLCL